MLMPINTFNQRKFINKINTVNNQSSTVIETSEINNDTFEKNNVSFQGRNLKQLQYEFSTNVVADVKKSLSKNLERWKEDIYETTYSTLKANRPDHQVRGRTPGSHGSYNTNNLSDRIMVGIFTFGITELDRAGENASYRKEARNQVDKMVTLRSELENIKMNEELAELNKKTISNTNEIKYETSIQDVKNDEIRPKLLDKVQRFREGRDTEMPNCIMFSHKDNLVNTGLIQWISERVNGNFEALGSEDIIEKLELLEEKYQQTKDWNVLYSPFLESQINTETSSKEAIATYKDIMSNCAEDYHTTIIFKTQNPDKLDSIALQPHRVTRIDTSNVKSKDELEIISARERLSNVKYIEDTPIAALNDLLLISGNRNKLNWDYSKKDFENAEASLKEFTGFDKAQINSILDNLNNIW